MDASNLLKPALQCGQLRCMGSTTYKEYRQHFEKDRALARRFQKIDVNEPTIPDTIKILMGLKPYFEEFHKVKYTNDAIKSGGGAVGALHHRPQAAGQGDRRDRRERRLDDAAAAEGQRKADRSTWTKSKQWSPRWRASRRSRSPRTTRRCCRRSTSDLKRVVFGQDDAIEQLSAAIKMARAGLREPQKPIGCYLFSGPTGVGKTEVARSLANIMGIELLRFDMSEYMERHTVSRLIGAPPGYVGYDQGGLLTDGVDQHPHCVLLLDEIEKAHPDLFNILLQVMDNGTLTDANGKKVDFRNVILIMTTNAGASDAAKQAIGFGAARRTTRTKRRSSGCSRRNSATASTRRSVRRPAAGDHPQGRAEVHHPARSPAGRPQRHDRDHRRGGRLAGQARLRRELRRPSAGPGHPGARQEADGRRASVRQARRGGIVKIDIDPADTDKLKFAYSQESRGLLSFGRSLEKA